MKLSIRQLRQIINESIEDEIVEAVLDEALSHHARISISSFQQMKDVAEELANDPKSYPVFRKSPEEWIIKGDSLDIHVLQNVDLLFDDVYEKFQDNPEGF